MQCNIQDHKEKEQIENISQIAAFLHSTLVRNKMMILPAKPSRSAFSKNCRYGCPQVDTTQPS